MTRQISVLVTGAPLAARCPDVAAALIEQGWTASIAATEAALPGSTPSASPRPATEQRPAAAQLHRQVWNGRAWALADDDRVFHPDRPAAAPAGDTAVFRPPDPPQWAGHGRPETRTTRGPAADDPRRQR